MRSKTALESCCGSASYLYIIETPILKEHVVLFESGGFTIMKQYLKSGILQAMKNKMNVTASIGQARLNAKCYGENCDSLYKDLEGIIEKIENAKG